MGMLSGEFPNPKECMEICRANSRNPTALEVVAIRVCGQFRGHAHSCKTVLEELITQRERYSKIVKGLVKDVEHDDWYDGWNSGVLDAAAKIMEDK